jgi:uncharacterized membrane protein
LLGAGVASGRRDILNVVTYRFIGVDGPGAWRGFLGVAVVAAGIVVLALIRRSSRRFPREPACPDPGLPHSSVRAGLPILITTGLFAGLALAGGNSFVVFWLLTCGIGGSLAMLGHGVPGVSIGRRAENLCIVAVLLAILASTAWHATVQVEFWRHFRLGYADFGFFLTELEHCLPWKEVGGDRFADTRWGYHAIPMFYLLTPLYAAFRSPAFLMVVGPLALNLAAIPFFRLAKDRTGSAPLALVIAVAWLALPSLSRLPYANTYGFQSIYLAVPWLAWALCLGLRGRWVWSHLCLAAALLCEETVCGVAVGWGIYLTLWGKRRRDGLLIVAGSVLYLVLCTGVLIPAFSDAGDYSRTGLFGDWTLVGVAERLCRPRAGLFLLALFGPMPLFMRGNWRLLFAAVPTLALILAMQDQDYLNIKFWHQSSVLPVVFAAAVMGVTQPRPRVNGMGHELAKSASPGLGPAVGLLVSLVFSHVWLGFSPLAQSYRLFESDPAMQRDDPRMAIVDEIKRGFSPKETVVLATERMAAHFTNFRMVYPASRTHIRPHNDATTLMILDRGDGWDKTVRSGEFDKLLDAARESGFQMVLRRETITILALPQEEAGR